MPSQIPLKKFMCLCCSLLVIVSAQTAIAATKIRTYRWQKLAIRYNAAWRVERDEAYQGNRMVSLYLPSAEKKYPISVMLTIMPLTPKIQKEIHYYENFRNIAVRFAAPYVASLTKSKKIDDINIGYNSIALDQKLAMGAMLTGITSAGDNVFCQAFAGRVKDYLIMGMIATHAANNIGEHATAQGKALNEVYQMLDSGISTS